MDLGWGFSTTWTREDTRRLVPEEVAPGEHWQSVAAAGTQLMAIRADGTLWGLGSNYGGELGTPSYVLAPLLIQQGHGGSSPLEPLAVYPNPARGTATVRSTRCDTPLYLFDMAGRQLRRFPSCTTALNLQGLASGLYVLRQGNAYTRLVVE